MSTAVNLKKRRVNKSRCPVLHIPPSIPPTQRKILVEPDGPPELKYDRVQYTVERENVEELCYKSNVLSTGILSCNENVTEMLGNHTDIRSFTLGNTMFMNHEVESLLSTVSIDDYILEPYDNVVVNEDVFNSFNMSKDSTVSRTLEGHSQNNSLEPTNEYHSNQNRKDGSNDLLNTLIMVVNDILETEYIDKTTLDAWGTRSWSVKSDKYTDFLIWMVRNCVDPRFTTWCRARWDKSHLIAGIRRRIHPVLEMKLIYILKGYGIMPSSRPEPKTGSPTNWLDTNLTWSYFVDTLHRYGVRKYEFPSSLINDLDTSENWKSIVPHIRKPDLLCTYVTAILTLIVKYATIPLWCDVSPPGILTVDMPYSTTVRSFIRRLMFSIQYINGMSIHLSKMDILINEVTNDMPSQMRTSLQPLINIKSLFFKG